MKEMKVALLRFGVNKNCCEIRKGHRCIDAIEMIRSMRVPDDQMINVTDATFFNGATGKPLKKYPCVTMDEFLDQREAFLVEKRYGNKLYKKIIEKEVFIYVVR